jgi:uncharacterized protein (TIGR04222 family)
MNPLELHGPEFLGFYSITLIVAIVVAWLVRRSLRLPAAGPEGALPELGPYGAACLQGGEAVAINVAVAKLVQRKVLTIDATDGKITVRGLVPDRAPAFEKIVCGNVGETGKHIWEMRRAVWSTASKLRTPLEEEGLLVSGTPKFFAHLLPALIVFAVTALGIAKIGVGASRHRPVGFLIPLTIFSGIIALVFLFKKLHRSRLGDAVLARLRQENAALETTARRRPEKLAEPDLSMALGLFGLGVLAGGPLTSLHTAILKAPPGKTAMSSGCGGSTCSSCGGGGGGGCGGGGCGGGGCGGCGG